MSTFEEKITFLESKITDKQRKFESLLNIFKTFKKRITEEKELLRLDLNSLNETIISFNSEKITIVKECSHVQNILKDMINKLAISNEKSIIQKVSLEKKIEENHNSITKINIENRKQIHDLEEKLIESQLQLENEKNQSYNILNEKSKIISKLQLENTEILKELEIIKADQLSSNTILKNLDHETLNEIKLLELTVEDLKYKLKMTQNNNAEIAKHNRLQNENFAKLQKEFQELKNKTDIEIIKQEDEIKRLSDKLQSDIENILTKELNTQMDNLVSENKNLSAQITEKNLMLERIKSQTDEFNIKKLQELTEINKKLIGQNTELKAAVKALKMS